MRRKFDRQSSEIIARARALRSNPSLPERLLWYRLAGNQFKLRRQYPVLNRYVIDLFFEDLRIAFEIDGNGSHDGRDAYDEKRQQEIEATGIAFVRIPARWVLRDPGAVCELILKICAGELQIEDLDISMH